MSVVHEVGENIKYNDEWHDERRDAAVDTHDHQDHQ